MEIPVYERRESLNPLPAARVRAAGSAEAYGAGIGRGLQGFAEGLRVAAEDFEDAETLELFNQFEREVNAYHLDPDKGIYNTRPGKGAAGASDDADSFMDNKAWEYGGKLKSPRAAANFNKMAQNLRNQKYKENSQWEAKQIAAYRNAEADASIQLAMDGIAKNYGDDEAVRNYRDTIYQALELKTRGLGDEARKAAFLEAESGMAMARIGGVAENSPLEAERWLEEHRDSFTPEMYEKAKAYVERETEPYRIEALRDGILADFEDEGKALEYIKENFSGDFEKKVMSAVEAEFADKRRIQNQREADAYDDAQNAVASASSYSQALAAISNSGLPPRLRDALVRHAKSKFGVGGGGAGGTNVDPDVWVNAKAEAMEFQAKSFGMSIQERAEAAKRFNAKYAGKISGSMLRTLNNVFFNPPGGSSGAGKDKYNKFNPNVYINKMIKDAGIDKDVESDMEFWDEYASRRRQKEAELGRELTNEEQLELGRKLTSQIVVQRKNNAAESFTMGVVNTLTGLNLNFDKDVTVTAPGYKIPEGAQWDEELGAWYYKSPDGGIVKFVP